MSPPHLVKEHLQLPVALPQPGELGQEPPAEVDVDQAGGAQLGHPGLLRTQAVEALAKRPAATQGGFSLENCHKMAPVHPGLCLPAIRL